MNESQELVTIVQNEARVDSRIVAKGLGIQHESLTKTLRRYQDKLEKLGFLRFETGEIDGRGQPEKYILLNEDQVTFACGMNPYDSDIAWELADSAILILITHQRSNQS